MHGYVYMYIWVDGIYFNIRLKDDRFALADNQSWCRRDRELLVVNVVQ